MASIENGNRETDKVTGNEMATSNTPKWTANSNLFHTVDQFGEDHFLLSAEVGYLEINYKNPVTQPVLRGEAPDTLNVWQATALAGNDISSSVLYALGPCFATAGAAAPFAFILVSFVLYIYKNIYIEVLAVLPLNGGTYTVLLNTTQKWVAALAATIAIMCYLATAVASAASAMQYFACSVPQPFDCIDGSELSIRLGVTIILILFAMVKLVGTSESANVSLAIFVLHLVTMLVLLVACSMSFDSEVFSRNFNMAIINDLGYQNWGSALFYGFGSAMVGVSGFETTANFVESQMPGIFPTVLCNLWLIVVFLNPIMAFLAMGLMPMSELAGWDQDYVMAELASAATHTEYAGGWLHWWVRVDGLLVLCGAVLTAYVGAVGLVARMASDLTLPTCMLAEGRCCRSYYRIILGFLALCLGIYHASEGNPKSVVHMFSIAFSVTLGLFAAAAIMLRLQRPSMPSSLVARTPWWQLIVAIIMVIISLVSNIWYTPKAVYIFLGYAAGIGLVVWCTAHRNCIMHTLAQLASGCGCESIRNLAVANIQTDTMLFFVKTPNKVILCDALTYIKDNEGTASRVALVHCSPTSPSRLPTPVVQQVESAKAPAHALLAEIEQLLLLAKEIRDEYPTFDIRVVQVYASFNPEVVRHCAHELAVHHAHIFISCPGPNFAFSLADVGARMITKRNAEDFDKDVAT